MEDRANVEEWFQRWHEYSHEGVDFEDVWNINETGFQIGYYVLSFEWATEVSASCCKQIPLPRPYPE
jgi:hypothetical protein